MNSFETEFRNHEKFFYKMAHTWGGRLGIPFDEALSLCWEGFSDTATTGSSGRKSGRRAGMRKDKIPICKVQEAFYPPNAYAQCKGHSDNRLEVYDAWMNELSEADRWHMAQMQVMSIEYTDELKSQIIRLCNADRLDELKSLI